MEGVENKDIQKTICSDENKSTTIIHSLKATYLNISMPSINESTLLPLKDLKIK
jgi:hypothetical protein